MAKSPFAKRDEQYELSRRALIKWTVAAGAALGVARSEIFSILEGTAGKGVAFAASTNATMRSIHIVAGNGGLAWFQLLWPQVDVAMSGNPNFSYHRPGMATLVAGTDRPFASGPDTPFAALPAARQMTCFTCGSNETHTDNPVSTSILNGNNIHAIAATLQATTPTVIPHVQIGQANYGTAQGAPTAALVGSADDVVGLFNSAASQAGGLLAMPSNASLYKAHFDAFAQLNRAAGRSTQKKAYFTASGAAGFLGTNLSAQLSIKQAELDMYGITGGTPQKVRRLAEGLIVAVKSFAMGLTNSVTMPAFNDDPHGAFDGGEVNTTPPAIKAVFDGFMAHLTATIDTATMKTLADDVMFTVEGDTPKDCLNRGGWPDGSPGNTNHIYVWGAGMLKTGWFGKVTTGGQAQGFDPAGNPTTQYNGAAQARLALASIGYAIAKRDERAISTFANGITVNGTIGIPLET
jgi:hypothetical protein